MLVGTHLAWWMYVKHGGCEVTTQWLTIAGFFFFWHVFFIRLEWAHKIALYYITYQTSFTVCLSYFILLFYRALIFFFLLIEMDKTADKDHSKLNTAAVDWERKNCFPEVQLSLETLEKAVKNATVGILKGKARKEKYGKLVLYFNFYVFELSLFEISGVKLSRDLNMLNLCRNIECLQKHHCAY